MKNFNRLGMIAVFAVGTVSAPAFAGNVTVGRFYTEFARVKRVVPVDAASTEAKLRGAGFNLPELDLEKSLTQGDMTSISNALGVAVTTQRPSQPIGESLMNTFMAAFGRQLGLQGGNIGNPFSVNADEQGDHDGDHRRHNRNHSRCDP